MKTAARKTRLTTRAEKAESVEISFKMEDANATDNSPFQPNLVESWSSNPSLNLKKKKRISRVEYKGLETKQVRINNERSVIVWFAPPSFFRALKVCEKRFSNKSNYRHHLRSALHKRMVTRYPISVMPDEFNPNNYCRNCNRAFSSAHNYRQHLKNIHKMTLTPLRPKPNPDISPNPDDRSNYCNSCNRTYSSIGKYSFHLERIHIMVLLKPQRSALDPSISPDIDDTNHYCKSYQVKYKTRNVYRQHLRRIQKMVSTPLRKQPIFDPTISADDTYNPNNTTCAICKVTYCSRNVYLHNMNKYHKNGRDEPINRVRSKINPNMQPDPDDPNFSCLPCQRHYSTNSSFRLHIRTHHPSTKLTDKRFSPSNPITLEVDAGNRNNKRCTICNRDLSSRTTYLIHMSRCHKDGKREPVLYREELKVDTNVIRVWEDPNNYCRSCKKTYSCKSNYHRYIKTYYQWPFKRRNPIINMLSNTSSRYCQT